jgi:hypothetical protein
LTCIEPDPSLARRAEWGILHGPIDLKQHEEIQMIEPSEQRIDEVKEQQQQARAEQTAVAQHQDTDQDLVSEATEAVVRPAEGLNRHAEAGRKGARRIHELIQQGRLYEREHGLKPGRQRLRQLIQEGKLYEREHGLGNGSRATRQHRRPRISSEQLVKTLFQTLLRVVKPAYRSRILSVIQALDTEAE